MTAEDLLERLRELDLLLSADPKFPSVAGLVLGEVHGQWWVHPDAKRMYGLSCALHDRPDVLTIKLISGKVTFVHRPLWPAIVVIGSAREPWQTSGLSKDAAALLKKVDRLGFLTSTGNAVRELEKRLLVRAESYHTDRGIHAKELESWERWSKSAKLGRIKLTPAEAKSQLESVVLRLNQRFGASGTLPWERKSSKRAVI